MTDMNLADTVKQEEILDISIERVDKLNSPLLVIGLGGTGADIVRQIKRTFAERYVLPRDGNGNAIPIPARTAYLVVDTDMKSMEGFNDNEYVSIALPGMTEILDPKRRDFNLTEFERKWVNKNLNSASHGLGAGTYRQAARFMLSRNYARIYNAISGALQNIVTVNAGDGASSGRTEIVVATGLCGGTGSGTFMDISQIIRHCMASEAILTGHAYKITGYLAMPDVSLPQVSGNQALENVLRQNGYAALKELDFWMNVGEHRTPYTVQYSGSPVLTWTSRPFDSCILMSAISVSGESYVDGYKVIQKTIAENLLHYLAYEQAEKKADGNVEYTYISYEDNLTAAVNAMDKRLPVYYGYRAIGAYTKRIPKKKLLYYEGRILFDTFIPKRDDQGRLVANPQLKLDGKSSLRAKEMTGDIKTLYTNFSADVKLPALCNVQPSQADDLERLRALTPRPHDRADYKPTPWLTSAVQPAALKASRVWLDAAWTRFTDFATQVMSDPALGPFSLQEYLSDKSKGFLPSLLEELRGWETNATNFRGNTGKRYEDCQNTWGNFLRPPMLAKRGAIEGYLKALVNYYDSARKQAFMDEHAAAFKKFVDRVGDYLDKALKPLCADLEALQNEFGRSDSGDDAKIVSDIFTLDAMKDRIDTQFKEGNTNNKVTAEFLRQICAGSLATVENVDAHGTGVTFTYRVNGKNATLDQMRKSLDSSFGQINGLSLDAIMAQTVGENLGAQNQFIDDLGKSVINSAQPLFSQNKAFANEDKAAFNYLSVPDNAPKHIARYKETLTGEKKTIPKGSSLRDHMYCTTAWDGLPLYRYSLMNSLERAYASKLSDPQVSMGVHLVWDGDLDSEYTANWTKLPSPCPYYFFGDSGEAYAKKAYGEVRELTKRARACGMLEVDASMDVPKYTLRLFYADSLRRNISASSALISQVDAMASAIDPRTGNKITPDKLKANVEGYLATANRESLPCSRKAMVLAPALGLQNDPINPWDEAIAANPASLAAAQHNHLLLCEEMAAAIVATQPRIMLALKHQVEGFEHARKVLEDIAHESRKWEPRIAYAPQVADMLIYGVLMPSIDGWTYASEAGSERHPLIQQNLLARDIRDESLVVLAAAYLGDQTADHLVRRELENQVKNRKDLLREKSNEGKLGKEDIQVMLKSIDKVLASLSKETNAHKDKQRKADADRQKEENILSLLAAMKNRADNETNIWNNMIDL